MTHLVLPKYSHLLAWLVFGTHLFAQDIQFKTSPDHRLFIHHTGYEADWQWRIPEVVECSEGTFMTSVRPTVEWKQFAPGTWGYDWTPGTNYASEVDRITGHRVKIIQGLRISPRVLASNNTVMVELRLENLSGKTFHDVTSDGGCLTHQTERFFDTNYNHSFIFTESGLTSLDKTDRSAGIRAKYFFNASWFETPSTRAYEFFWGRSSTRPTKGLIVSQALAGKGAVGIAWENCMGVRQNSDASHRCMHSSPYFGDLRPGQSMVRKGVLLFGDSAEQIAARFESASFGVYTMPPSASD